MSRRIQLRAALRLAVILTLGLVLSGVAVVHTDDGCAVEKHCQACVAALNVGIVVTAFVFAISPGPAAPVATREPITPASRDSVAAPSRGPPQA
jgi:hypothetical protein